jgi:hypothetical protein
MTVIGTVRNGKVILPPEVSLPDGTEVSVEILKSATETTESTNPDESRDSRAAFTRELMKFAGIVKDMPPDYSINHDHYLYGVPKAQ